MTSRRYLSWAIERIIMIFLVFLVFLVLVWLSASIQTDTIVKFESQKISINIIKNILALASFMVLGADFVMGIMKLSFVKRHSGFLGWLVIIISFGIGGYLSIKFGY